MKKYLFLLISISILLPSKIYAVDITAGVTTWYTNIDESYTKPLGGEGQHPENDPAFLIGPALSVKLNDDFNLTFILLWGKLNVTAYPFNGGKIDYKFNRVDSDLALNYRLNDYFKVFAGIKYMSFSTSRAFDSTATPNGALYKLDHTGFGPGFGLNFTYPIIENLFFIGNLSGFYIWSKETKGHAQKPAPPYYPPYSYPPIDGKTNCKDFGQSLSLSLAYYIVPASTTISLGYRMQDVKTSYDQEYIQELYDGYNEKCSFSGITLTATYSFSI